jgi:aspartate racemase
MRKYVRKLGILGGMGPEATASLYLGIISRCQRELGAKYNSDFPPIIINSCPVPDGRMWRGFNKSKVEQVLRSNVKLLEKAGADFIAIPCNSVHYFLPVMRSAVKIPVLSIVEETAQEIRAKGVKNVLLLGTMFTVDRQIYDNSLTDRGITLVKPDVAQKRLVERIIIKVESGRRTQFDRASIIRIINNMKKKSGVEGVIAGCTEIPLLVRQSDLDVPLFDTIDILATSTYELIRGKRDFKSSLKEPE